MHKTKFTKPLILSRLKHVAKDKTSIIYVAGKPFLFFAISHGLYLVVVISWVINAKVV